MGDSHFVVDTTSNSSTTTTTTTTTNANSHCSATVLTTCDESSLPPLTSNDEPGAPVDVGEVVVSPSTPPPPESTWVQRVQVLIGLVNEISRSGGYRKTHKKDCLTLARRIKLLMPFFEELKDATHHNDDGSPDTTLFSSFSVLEKSLLSAKELLQLCHRGSKLFLVVENEAVLGKFMKVTEELDSALDTLPLKQLKVSDEVREQVELMHIQLKRSKGRADTQDVELFMDLMIVLSQKGARNADSAVLERLANKLQLETAADISMEIRAIKQLIREKGGKIDETVENITYLLKKIRSIQGDKIGFSGLTISENTYENISSSLVPEDYRCPISLELMKDPVIVATGQTYDRPSIQRWFDAGHHTCPKTQQVLSHLTLTPNYVLRSLIAQWCETHGVELPSQGSSGQADNSEASSRNKMSINTLVQKLYSKQTDLQRSAAEEIRLLAKRNSDNRLLIAEAGAIPQLVKLLSSKDSKTQEHAVTALLNLSIHSSNKGFIVQAGAINRIIEVLKHGTMEARENAAATLFSLSVTDENKVTIGGAGAIPPLVDLLRDGTTRGKKDAATALFNLSIYQVNKARAVRAGVVPPLMALLVDQSMGMVDEALAILAILATHHEGRVAIGQQSAIHTLVELIRSGSARNKENAAAVLLALSVNDTSNLLTALQLGVYENLLDLSQKGTGRARRKATTLLEVINKEKLAA